MATHLLKEHPTRVLAAFIHDVIPGDRTGDGGKKAWHRQHGVRFFDTYAGAAAGAFEAGLLSAEAAKQVALASLEDLLVLAEEALDGAGGEAGAGAGAGRLDVDFDSGNKGGDKSHSALLPLSSPSRSKSTEAGEMKMNMNMNMNMKTSTNAPPLDAPRRDGCVDKPGMSSAVTGHVPSGREHSTSRSRTQSWAGLEAAASSLS